MPENGVQALQQRVVGWVQKPAVLSLDHPDASSQIRARSKTVIPAASAFDANVERSS
jgi:hypothetical protein